jgi:tetratricopeptide (TPR) repeat protein
VRKLLEAIGRERPLVVLVDDIHSAEQTLLELLDHLVEAGRDSQIVLLCSARRELFEKHEEWAQAHEADLVVLEPLSDADSDRMVEELLGKTGLDDSVVARITSAAEGNPLFVEQMVSMLIDTGALRQEGGRWVAAAAASEIAVPPSIHALLAARFDSLAVDEKRVLEPASVIGLSFAVPAIDELVDEAVRPTLALNLVSLDRKQFVKPTTLDEDEAYKFAHILVRDTAYGSLLKRARAQYHERFVDWAERINAERGRGQEFEEIHGYHLEQAFRYRTELGVVDERARGLGRRGAVKLTSAGQRAFVRGDAPAAANLLRRAVALLPSDDPWRIELLPDLAEALKELGEFGEAESVLADAANAAGVLGDARLLARIRLSRLAVNLYSGTAGPLDVAIQDVESVIPLLDAAEDWLGLASAWRVLLLIYGTSGQYDRGAVAAQRVVDYAMRARETRLVGSAAINYSVCALHGPASVPEAIARCAELVDTVRGDRKAEALILSITAVLHAMEGRIDRARELYARSREMVVDLGASTTAASMSIESSRVEMLAGNHDAAIRELTRDYDTLEAVGETYFRSSVAGLLGHALWAAGRHDDADRYVRIAEDTADADDVDSQIIWRTARAKLIAEAGSVEEAIALARGSVSLAATTDDIERRADALRDLATVLAIAGRTNEQGPPLREALELYERKGDRVFAGRVRAALSTDVAARL